MSFRATLLKRSCLALLLPGLLIAPSAFGQAINAKGQLISPVAFVNQEAITTTFVPAPTLGDSSGAGGTGGGTEPGQWLKVEFHYGTTAALLTPYLDSVEFKIWIEGLDPLALNTTQASGKGVAIALTGTVTYVNVPAGKDVYGVFYVHPSTLARYSSDRGYEDYDRKFDVHLEAYVGGTLMDKIDKNKETDPNWFQALKPITGLVYRQNQCPFMVSDPDRYPAIKLDTSGQ